MFDLFKLLGLEKASKERKEKYQKEYVTLVIQYFLADKVGDSITRAQMEELMEKYPPESEENVNQLLQHIGERI